MIGVEVFDRLGEMFEIMFVLGVFGV